MLLAIYFIAAALILGRGLFFIINHMGRHTAFCTRLAWLLLTTGALDVLLGPVFGRVPAPSYGNAILLAGFACYLIWRTRIQSIFEGDSR